MSTPHPPQLPRDVVVVQVQGDQLVQRPQARARDEAELVVGDGEVLQVACTHHVTAGCLHTPCYCRLPAHTSQVIAPSFMLEKKYP